MLEARGCFSEYSTCQDAQPTLIEGGIQRRKKCDLYEIWKQYIEEKSFTVVNMWEGEWWKLYEVNVSVREHLRGSFLQKRPLRQDQSLDKIESGALFDYVKCDIKVSKHLREQFANFPLSFRNTNVCRQDARSLLQE